MYKNDLIKKIWLISKIMTSQPGSQTIAIHALPNISKSKDNQTMTFGQLIEYNMRNIFFEKSYTKNVVEKLFPNPFQKVKTEKIFGSLKFCPVCSYYIAS